MSTANQPSASPAEAPSEISPEDSALGFNLLTSMGLRPHHRVLHRGASGAPLGRLLAAYLRASCYISEAEAASGPPPEGTYDVVVVHCDDADGPATVAQVLGSGRAASLALLVATWSAAAAPGEVRQQWLDAALEGELSVEMIRLGDSDWFVFRPMDHLLTAPLRAMPSAQGAPILASTGDAAMATGARDGDPASGGVAETPEGSQRRLEQEIARYRDCVNVHDLPEIYHFWSHRYVRPKLLACGFKDVDDFFLQNLLAVARQRPEERHRVASIGAGNCDLEVRLAVLAKEQGVENLLFHCLELNPHMIERGRELARHEGVSDLFELEVIDIDTWEPRGPHGACIANHSLHHIVELESLFAKIQRAIGEQGVFLTNDMIGRNGHMRWPEALRYVQDIWRQMPQRYKYNHQLQRWEDELDNWDCSKEGNEGIRAEDILPLLLKSFHFESFMAFGNIIDVFVDRSFGHNFDAESEEDRDFIERVAKLDEEKLDSGEIKPTHIIAAMRTQPVAEPKVYRHWTPEFCLRDPAADKA